MDKLVFSNSNFKKYLEHIKAQLGSDTLKSLIETDCFPAYNAPFLSVIMRTQGKRPEALREAVLCLSAQTNTDFELLIMCHNVDNDKQKTVDAIVDETPDWLKEKIRVIPVAGGTRTTPLEHGFENARGIYVSIFDDDDIIFDNWVEAFYDLYLREPGTILHSYAVEQDFEEIKCHDSTALVSASAPRDIYCKDFEFVRQLSQNFCPTMSLAFPKYVFDVFGVRFDEQLSTTEDWDFLMRCAFVCGVSNTPTVTSIYRKWVNAENSSKLHGRDEWNKNHRLIQNRFMTYPAALPLEELKGYTYSADSDTLLPDNLRHIELFIDSGHGFVGTQTAKLQYEFKNGAWAACASGLEKYEKIRMIRFDPDDFGVLSLDELSVSAAGEDKKAIALRKSFIRSNYVKAGKSLVFFGKDPQVVLPFKRAVKCSEITITFNMSRALSARKTVFSAMKYVPAYLIRSFCRVGYHTLKRIKNIK